MSRYDPNALPFWEEDRGDGPLTRAQKLREADKLRPPVRESNYNPSYGFAQGCSRVSASGIVQGRTPLGLPELFRVYSDKPKWGF